MTLIFFFVLQLCDLLTTLVFLHRGVSEANPLLSAAFRLAATPAVGLAAIKLAGCGLALYSWRTDRMRLLKLANVFFMACVCWNLVAIAVS